MAVIIGISNNINEKYCMKNNVLDPLCRYTFLYIAYLYIINDITSVYIFVSINQIVSTVNTSLIQCCIFKNLTNADRTHA